MRERLAAAALHESPVVVVAGLISVLVLLGLGAFVTPDTWLAVLAGRVVDRSGPPAHDTLAAWTLGRTWVDQQWLGQLVLFRVWRAGGMPLVGALHAAVLIGTFVLVLAGARRRGGTPPAVGVVAALALTPLLLVAGNIRTQTFAFGLFVVVVALLARYDRAPSARALVVLPLLVAWANLHGSVLVGVALAMLAGALGLLRAARDPSRRASLGVDAALVVLAPLTLLATPYGTGAVAYFGDIFGNGEIKRVAPEWTPPGLEAVQLPFFALAALTVVVVVRGHRRFGAFELCVLAGTLAAALQAQRNLGWFALAATLLVPAAVPRRRPLPAGITERVARPLALAAVLGTAAAAVVGLTSMDRRVAEEYPPALADAVARAAAATPPPGLFTHPRYADWLVLRHPELAGKVPFDIRFELLTEAELRRFRTFRERDGGEWRAILGDARLLLLDRSDHPIGSRPSAASALRAEPGARTLLVQHDAAVVLRPQAPAP